MFTKLLLEKHKFIENIEFFENWREVVCGSYPTQQQLNTIAFQQFSVLSNVIESYLNINTNTLHRCERHTTTE